MKALVQRALGASVSVDGEVIGSFLGPGLVVLIGVTHADDTSTAHKLAEKIYNLRIFAGSAGEVSASDLNAPLLVISQFTLYAETKKGRRPSWDAAAPAPVAEPLVQECIDAMRQLGAQVQTGKFGADMHVSFTNDGPITILLELDPQLQ